ncbi:hypothetical protein QF019_004285 [Pseudomonas frederiksbergensis]|uniref:hypothetical protein n=1 Tax=Pseudomonas frederiksbergensis TaxID=104087 RepID=UPI003D24AFDC
MSPITNISTRYSFGASLHARTQRNAADKFERDLIIDKLQEAILRPAEYQSIDWSEHSIDLKPGSSLDQLHRLGSALLNKLVAEPFIQQLSVQLFRQPLTEAFVNSDGSLFIRGDAWEPITEQVNRRASTQSQLKCLTDVAAQTGGIVSTTQNVEVSQWMKFHDLTPPTTRQQNRNLLYFLTFAMPSADHLGQYWSQLFTNEPGATVLSSEQQSTIRTATSTLLPPRKKLLDKLHEDLLQSRQINADEAGDVIKSLVSHPTSRALAKRYIDALGWYGANINEPLNDEDLDQLLVTAILLDLQPATGTQGPLGSFDLYSPDNVDLPHFLVREQLQAYLVNNQRVTARAAPLAAHLLLAHVAPQFLVKQLPSTPLLGSIGWVTFSRTVALIESQTQGTTRLMTFAQVMEYAGFDTIGVYQEKLSGLAAINPIIDWALMNNVITPQAWQQSSAIALQQATSAYQAFLEQLNQAATAFSTPAPSRRALALAQLEKILPDCDYLEKEFLTHAGTSWQYQAAVPFAGGDLFQNVKMSMVELHMSGDLAGQEWNDPSADLFKKHPTLLAELNSLSVDYETQVRDYEVQLNKALITNLKLALAQLDEDDQKNLLRSEITFYSVRTSAAFEIKAPTALNGMIGVDVRTTVETPESIEAATGHYGVVMCATYRGQTTCYELFSLHGKCLKNPRLGAAINAAGLASIPLRADVGIDAKQLLIPATLHSMPLDISNYTHGSVPNRQVFSDVVLDKLGVMAAPASTTERKKGVYQRFYYPQFERMAQFIARRRPLATFQELNEVAKGQTKLEKLISKHEERTEFMLNLIIPFRACIMDLASGERVRVAQGVFGCIMDAIAVVGGIVGAASKISAIMSRTVSSCSRIASIAKELVVLAIGTFNPLDGLKGYAVHGAKLFFKGGLRLNRIGIEVATKARTQIHRLTNMADSYDLVKASKRTDLAQGTWIPKDSSDATNVWACRSRNNQWHALNRFGRPWGESLKNFRRMGEIRLPRLDKQLPSIYTRTLIENALSTARLKVDAATRVLSQANKKVDVDKLVDLLLGSGPIEAVNTVLMAQKSYYSAVSTHNFLLEDQDTDDEMFIFNFAEFEAWKNAGLLRSEKKIIKIVCADLNERFHENNLNEGVIADDLLRALFHAGQGVVDLSIALPLTSSNARYQQVDVAPLLNLANGQLPITDEGVPARNHDRNQARNNADSWAVLTSLLSQLETDPATFAQNLSAMSAALQANRRGAITQPVPINLNRV